LKSEEQKKAESSNDEELDQKEGKEEKKVEESLGLSSFLLRLSSLLTDPLFSCGRVGYGFCPSRTKHHESVKAKKRKASKNFLFVSHSFSTQVSLLSCFVIHLFFFLLLFHSVK
jgi:hypothetical protein